MSEQNFRKLIARYKGDRTICNCGLAYEDSDKNCKYGCTANIRSAKHEIADRVVQEFDIVFN